jgi:uncharacterized zinc-type alcohol dehydrogenase-like protein
VPVLSQTLSKRDEALRFGADHYYVTRDPTAFTELVRQLHWLRGEESS